MFKFKLIKNSFYYSNINKCHKSNDFYNVLYRWIDFILLNFIISYFNNYNIN